jgi:nicotinamide mononucleotide adenylyltransferase
MKKLKRIARLIGVSIIVFFFQSKSKANDLSTIDKRIEIVRKKVKDELKNKRAAESAIPFENYTNNSDWVNWGNWSNWNNWNNWAKWNDWNNWRNWSDWGNWRNY